ncbi:hypothetical protein BDR04DRAFT_1093036 [Suillus decipiens]|nr:hypothetical protein BDR04DRAFT_1093036 [Suillus decipiens]
MVKSKQLHQTQQEKVQKTCPKLLEDHRTRRLTSATDLHAWEAEKAAHTEKEGRRQRQHSTICDACGPMVVFSGTLSSKSKADLLELA